jgi:hypothetical protein
MDLKKFSLIKYDHGQRVGLSAARWLGLTVILVTVVLTIAVFPPVLFLGIFGLILVFRQPKQIFIGPRYLICGKNILYYANVQRLILETDRLILKTSTGGLLVVELEKFQSNARKPEKIALHKENRFNKVAQKIVKHVRRAAPHAELKGVEKLPATGT